ncbi:MAG: hypothetical protein IKZ82_03505 [Clostridia bacterium]|nr:hypothetical protein [Clostridia bacterium]
MRQWRSGVPASHCRSNAYAFKADHLIPAPAEYPKEAAETEASCAASIAVPGRQDISIPSLPAPILPIGAELIEPLSAV